VPQAVFVECTAAGAGQLVADRIRVQAWIETRDVADRALVTQLRRELDAGEAEAIALAFELKQIGCYFMSGLAVLWQRASVCLSSGYWASSCLLNSAATFPRSSWCLTI
jgi:hypothetical protein